MNTKVKYENIYQINIPQEHNEKLDELVRELHLCNKANLINNSLTLFNWVVGEIKQGRIIASVDPITDTYREVTMPVFSLIAPHDRQPA